MNFEGYGDTEGMALVPPDDAILVRQSTTGSMDLCPARVGYELAAVDRSPPSEAMSFGTMIHSFAEWRVLGNTGIVTIKQLEEWWVEGVEKDGFDLYELIEPDKMATSLQEAIEACAAFDRDVHPVLDLSDEILIEEKMMMPMGVTPAGREVWLQGTGDLTDVGSKVIIDWKTAGRGWDQSKADSTHQAQAYQALTEYTTGVLIETFHYWVWNRSKREWVLNPTQRSVAQTDAWLRHAWMVGLQIEAGAFPFTPWQSTFGKMKRGWWCSPKFCAAWDVCVGKYLPDDVWEGTPIDIKANWQ